MAIIRTAMKTHLCVNAHAHRAGNAPNCRVTIKKGDRYEQGDVDPYFAGGFGHERVCLGCSPEIERENGRG